MVYQIPSMRPPESSLNCWARHPRPPRSDRAPTLNSLMSHGCPWSWRCSAKKQGRWGFKAYLNPDFLGPHQWEGWGWEGQVRVNEAMDPGTSGVEFVLRKFESWGLWLDGLCHAHHLLRLFGSLCPWTFACLSWCICYTFGALCLVICVSWKSLPLGVGPALLAFAPGPLPPSKHLIGLCKVNAGLRTNSYPWDLRRGSLGRVCHWILMSPMTSHGQRWDKGWLGQ